jgi:hypothetical protein
MPDGHDRRAYAPDLVSTLLHTVSTHSGGDDPSVGTTKIFGIEPADEAAMDKLLLPPNFAG